MKNLIILFLLLLFSCKEKTENIVAQQKEVVKTDTIFKKDVTEKEIQPLIDFIKNSGYSIHVLEGNENSLIRQRIGINYGFCTNYKDLDYYNDNLSNIVVYTNYTNNFIYDYLDNKKELIIEKNKYLKSLEKNETINKLKF